MRCIEKFIWWQALRTKEISTHYFDVVLKWNELLSDKNNNEPIFLKFLHENAGMFFHDSKRRLISISEFEFGADLRADFVICQDRSSYGFEYEFVEVESPNDSVYTKKGIPSSHLSEAINQIQQWRMWIDANRAEAKRILPSKSFIVADEPAFKYTIIIGRRDQSEDYLHMRNNLGRQLGIEIRSFDHLTDKLMERRFDATPKLYSSQVNELEFSTKNQLANPFSKSFKSSVWRKMVKSPKFSSHHMISTNAKLILDNRELNDGYDGFLKNWFAVDITIRNMLFRLA